MKWESQTVIKTRKETNKEYWTRNIG